MSVLPHDKELLAAFRDGESEALGRVYVAYADHVENVVRQGFSFRSGSSWYRFTGDNTDDSSDLVQEVFRRAFERRARHAYDGERPFKIYLASIARNLVIDKMRARKRIPTPVGSATDEFDEVSQEMQLPQKSPEDNVSERELMNMVGNFRKRLTSRHGGVFSMRFKEGLDQNETGRRLGMSLYKVRRMEKDIRKGLLKHLRLNGYFGRTSS